MSRIEEVQKWSNNELARELRSPTRERAAMNLVTGNIDPGVYTILIAEALARLLSNPLDILKK